VIAEAKGATAEPWKVDARRPAVRVRLKAIAAQTVLGHFTETARAAVRRPGRFPQLTAREVEILEHVAAGHSNPQIARTLFLSEKTVRNHVSAIFTKLQVADRSQAIVKTREAGLGASWERGVRNASTTSLRRRKDHRCNTIAEVSKRCEVRDLSIGERDIEDVVRRIYGSTR
jgi:DNA-binding CsgD family transcriptional regulator